MNYPVLFARFPFRAAYALGGLLLCAFLLPLPAAAGSRLQTFPLAPPPNGGTDPGSSGAVAVRENPTGPDSLRMFANGLAPNTCYAMFLVNNPTTASTPGSLLGGFCTNKRGSGKLAIVTEIFDGFVISNRVLDTDGDGIVVGQGAGVIANGGFMVPTNVIRIYRAQPDQGTQTVFSSKFGTPGGLHALSSPAIVRPAPPAQAASGQ